MHDNSGNPLHAVVTRILFGFSSPIRPTCGHFPLQYHLTSHCLDAVMKEMFHKLDPAGDVVLILQNPNAAFALWRSEPSPGHSPQADSESSAPLDKTLISLRVSSSHLTLASLHFKNMFKTDCKEARTLRADGCVEIYESGWDSDALLILMNIIHGQTRKVPRIISLEMLAKVAVLVDYYKCVEVAEPFSEIWIGRLKGDLPETSSRDVILWICISSVFRLSDLFLLATSIAIKQGQGPFWTLGLPISRNIVGMYSGGRWAKKYHATNQSYRKD
jgi:hypothetical protein